MIWFPYTKLDAQQGLYLFWHQNKHGAELPGLKKLVMVRGLCSIPSQLNA